MLNNQQGQELLKHPDVFGLDDGTFVSAIYLETINNYPEIVHAISDFIITHHVSWDDIDVSIKKKWKEEYQELENNNLFDVSQLSDDFFENDEYYDGKVEMIFDSTVLQDKLNKYIH